MAAAAPAPVSDVLQAAGLLTLGTEPAPEAVEAVLRELVRLLNGSDPLRRAGAQSEAVRLLTAAKVNRAAALVDAAFAVEKRLEAEAPDRLQGQSVALVEPEPWPDPVDGAELLAEQSRTFARFLALPEGAATALPLWVLHTYALPAAFVSPILAILSPEKRCGKTTLLTLLGALVNRPMPVSSLTPGVLFRLMESFHPTLLADEVDTYLKRNEELRGVFNSGHSRATAWIPRCVGDEHTPRLFSTFGAKAVAGIGRIPGTIEDRSIAVPLQRRTAGEAVERLRLDRLHSELESLRRKCVRWTLDNLDALRQADPGTPEELHDRAADNWRPLLAIADAAGGIWPERARKAAMLLGGAADDGDSAGPMLLADVRDVFNRKGADRLTSANLVAELVKMEERPWPEWRGDKPLTVRQLARLLAPFEVRPKQIRLGNVTVKGYAVADFKDAFDRYLPRDPKQPKQSSTGAEEPASTDRNERESVSDDEQPENPSGDLLVSAVSIPAGGPEPEETEWAGAL